MDIRTTPHLSGSGCCAVLLCVACSLFSLPLRAEVVLASNEQVLQAWQQLTQSGTATPELVTTEQGATNIEWHGGVTVDAYGNSASGGTLLTPTQTGNFYMTTVQGDLRKTLATGGVSYMQFTAAHSNDRAVLSHNSQLQMFQAGVVENNYGLAVGDVTAGFSTLGTNTQMKGIYGYRQVDGIVVSASVGKLIESWEVWAGGVENTQYESNAHAIKLDMAVGNHGRLFLTNQAYSQDEESLDVALRSVSAAQADTTTMGFVWQKERTTLQGEYGNSDWEESGGSSYRDDAVVIDGQWRGDKGGLNAGHHDIGGYYSSLSADVTPGVAESYIGGDWLAAEWLSTAISLRRSEYEHASSATDIELTDALTVQLGVALESLLKGLNLSLQQSVSLGTTVDNSSNEIEDHAINLSYAAPYWSAQLGNSSQQVENSGYPETNSTTDTWTLGTSVSLNRQPERADLWSMTLGLNATWQTQQLQNSGDITNSSYTFSVNGQRQGWGSLMASYTAGFMEQAAGGPQIEQQQVNIEALRGWGANNSFKLYLRDNANSGDPASNYEETTAGMQVAVVW